MGEIQKIKYALVGAGSRARMFIDPLATIYQQHGELVALVDPNPGRLNLHKRTLIEEMGYGEVNTYPTEEFDRMVKETKPDVVIVTTVDAVHHEYIIRAMELGCDVITEKPITTDATKCNAIMDTVRRTGRRLRVAFNYRWSPGTTRVREVLSEGTIGDLVHVDMEYWLNTSHGADYFRRWHREKQNSGGLIVHKATHHFDLVNWWIDAIPDSVYGVGRLAFYGRQNAEARGETVVYDRYSGQETSSDPFAIDISIDARMKELYMDNEKYDGYLRDRNVFSDGITIEDSMSLVVKYRTGVVLNYSLNAFLPREGFRVAFNGTKGRIEYEENHSSNIVAADSKKTGMESSWSPRLVVYPMFGEQYEVDIPLAKGGHGGGDRLLQRQIFDVSAEPDVLKRDAGHQQGAASAVIGFAANNSFDNGEVISISEICPALDGANRLSELE